MTKESVRRDEKENTEKTLDVGGGSPRENYVSIDINPEAHIVHDLNKYPWPVKSNSYSNILMSHVLEHLDNPLEAMHEAYRIAKSGAVLEIRIPWWKTDMFSDPVHIRWFKPEWFTKLWNRKSNAAAISAEYDKSDINWKVIRDKKIRGRLRIYKKYEYHVWLRAIKK